MNQPFDPKLYVKNLTSRPGVYRMLNEAGEVIYVGKARNLKKRVGSYFAKNHSAEKTRSLVRHIARIEVTVTHTESEALILENNLIKQLQPRYNILMRDDKSYPYIHLSGNHEYPRLTIHRGSRKAPGRYFGPFPSAGAVRESLRLMQKLFPVRQCEDSFFRNRSRPCLQHQIGRCSAPCVGLVSKLDYQQHLRHAELFLLGKNQQVMEELAESMTAAANGQDYERAAVIRDQIVALRTVQERQSVDGAVSGNLDVLAVVVRHGVGVVELVSIRNGRNLGSRTYYPRLAGDEPVEAVLAAFIAQHYIDRVPPAQLTVSCVPEDVDLLERVLGDQIERRVKISKASRGGRLRWVKMATTNAEQALSRRLADKANLHQRYEALQASLQLESVPTRMECFDISHTQGEGTVASCVVFDSNGPLKSDYRRFNIKGVTGGDDYAAIAQAVQRRYVRLQRGEGKLPDLLIIDGGKGQLAAAAAVLEDLGVVGLTLMSVAKGVARRPGQEQLFLWGRRSASILPADSPALHLIQQIRDEAHRFAITGHRARRAKTSRESVLEQVPGMGPKRRQQLLSRFGGLQAVQRAGVDDLARVPGISRKLAEAVYDQLHGEDR
ncbi:MAG: excinuclease ABC subunit UvrC [Gammaproteobacteria bacterium]|nr:excinuclease ABC subunit UvrC [Gammaproteobacteria bacterium]